MPTVGTRKYPYSKAGKAAAAAARKTKAGARKLGKGASKVAKKPAAKKTAGTSGPTKRSSIGSSIGKDGWRPRSDQRSPAARTKKRKAATKKPGGVKAAAPGKKKGLAVKRGKDGKLTLKVSPKYSISLYKDAQKSAKQRSQKAKRTRERARRS
jgi:hypothetical protein